MTEPDGGAGLVADGEWHRTDVRMVLITLVQRLGSLLLPVAFIAFQLEDPSESRWSLALAVVAAVVAIASAVATWYATRYRFDAERLEIRRGILQRKRLSARVDRVRSVELEAPLMHRVLGLAKVTIGTGRDAERITLDSLNRVSSAELREQLLRLGRAAAPVAQPDAGQQTADAAHPDPAHPHPAGPADGVVLARLDPSWIRFAPAGMLGGTVLLAVTLGGLWLLLRDTRLAERLLAALSDSAPSLAVLAATLAVGGGAAAATLSWVTKWWGMTLTREPGGTLHLSRGLLTTTSSTLELARVRGVELDEPLPLRALGGARIEALTTGVGTVGSVELLPPGPRDVAAQVAREVLGADPDDDPLTVPTQGHGFVARRRLWVGAVTGTAVLSGIVWALAAWRGWQVAWPLMIGGLLLLRLALAESEHRIRGYALTGEHLVVTSGRVRRRRVVLQTRGIIGWTLTQSLLQRRVGLATLTATTAAGPGSVAVVDVPLGEAVTLAAGATPDLWGRPHPPVPLTSP